MLDKLMSDRSLFQKCCLGRDQNCIGSFPFEIINLMTILIFRTNLIAIISGGPRPMFAENNVMVYDDQSNKVSIDDWT